MPYKDKAKNDACKRAYEAANKEAIYAKRRAKYAASPEIKEVAAQRSHKKYISNPEHRREVRANDLRARFNLTIEEYETRREAQRLAGDLCGVCRQPLGEKTAHLDHDHDTKQIREFCHSNCNMALGLLQDDPNVCRLAAEYLERHGKLNGNGNFNT
jgi:hypothetical protein